MGKFKESVQHDWTDDVIGNVAQLHIILDELNTTDKRFLTDTLRATIINNRVTEMLEQGNDDDLLTEVLINGFKGYSVFTDLELCDDLIESLDVTNDLTIYSLLDKEVKYTVAVLIEEAIGLNKE